MPRYGQQTWSDWRNTGDQDDDPRPPRILELEGRRISSGFYDNDDGRLKSLVVETVAGYGGGYRLVVGKNEPFWNRNLVESPPSVEPPLKLA